MKFENTKTIRTAYDRYCKSNLTYLYHCYEKPSEAKWEAMENCLAYMRELDGRNMRIISYSKWVFTVGFIFKDEDGKDSFVYITPTHNRYMHI